MIVALMGFAMTGANLYGYLRCKWSNTQEFTNYVSKLAFLSVSILQICTVKLQCMLICPLALGIIWP